MKCMSITRRSFVSVATRLGVASGALAPRIASAAKGDYLVYIGTYTNNNSISKGIYAYRFSEMTGQAEPLGLVAETPNPSFLAIHPNRKFLYAVSELYARDGDQGGAVSAFAIDAATGKLSFLNKVSSKGGGPCHLVVDKTGKSVLVANYGTGSAAALPLKSDGGLGEASSFVQHSGSSVNPKRQQGPHAHSINLSRDNKFAVVADLGLDQVLVYRFDPAKATLAANDPPFVKVKPGAGPRHFAFHPNAKFAYVINEIQSTVTALSWDAARGAFSELQTITTLPEGFSENNSTAEVQVHPSGKFLYGSNRGHNSIAVFAIDQAKGTLKPLEHAPTQGRTPRNFGVSPGGTHLWAANQNSNNITIFKIDSASGKLTPTGTNLEIGSPVCVKFLAL